MHKESPAFDLRRLRRLNDRSDRIGPVIYWMSRDQRAEHNWALLYACLKANELRRPLEVLFTLTPSFLGATRRHYDFMFRGLADIEASLRSYGIPLTVLSGEPGSLLPAYAGQINAGVVVTDFSPLKIHRAWKQEVADLLICAFYEVDAHNIVPCWLASAKQEYAARTIRPKLEALRASFLTTFPDPDPQFQPATIDRQPIRWKELADSLAMDDDAPPADWPMPGEQAAETQLRLFVEHGLNGYAESRNDPNSGCVSKLSPYLHFGNISAQHVALSVARSDASIKNRTAFIEELFIRRELAENYCFHNDRYDTFDGLPDWAKRSLMIHAGDHREYLYTLEEFENACTHDHLWNAAQTELTGTGRIHGYMRMYWAKKILEWSATPSAAFDIAVSLNDRHALDGRDPNGYTGIAWSIGGLHDRPWFERPIYGKIRYMNAAGCARKFDVMKYIESVTSKERPGR